MRAVCLISKMRNNSNFNFIFLSFMIRIFLNSNFEEYKDFLLKN
jgi:hypothetical protein